jgi:exopolyphosphatase / guanosine-5'-triphosphate,3'-diphosphate pyrophosphatase
MTPERPREEDAIPEFLQADDAEQALVEPSTSPQSGSGQLYAALDLGTNSCRMLIARPRGSQFQVVDSFSKTVQLGAGLEASGRLSRVSMTRTIQALRICQKKLEKHRVKRMRLVATEACRRAKNARDFIRQVRRESGLQLEIIAPEDEARLAVISCAPLVSVKTEQLLVVDIGGGSTELVWIDLTGVEPSDRPRAIMRLHAGFKPQGAGQARVVDWISVWPP